MTLLNVFFVWLFGVILFLHAAYFFFSYINQYEMVCDRETKKNMLFSTEMSLYTFGLVSILMENNLNVAMILILIAIFHTEVDGQKSAPYPKRLSVKNPSEATILVQFLLVNLCVSTLTFPIFDKLFLLLFIAEFLLLIISSLLVQFRKD